MDVAVPIREKEQEKLEKAWKVTVMPIKVEEWLQQIPGKTS